MKYLLYILLIFQFQLSTAQYTIKTVPNKKLINNSYVSDPDNYLENYAIQEINQLCKNLEDSTSAQVAVVVLNSIGADNPHDFGTRLFNYWGIGQRGIDNGLLILMIMDQRRVEFITGNGFESVLPDQLCYCLLYTSDAADE